MYNVLAYINLYKIRFLNLWDLTKVNCTAIKKITQNDGTVKKYILNVTFLLAT